jgi:hypothetical protein
VSELSLHNGTVFTLLFHALVAQIVETAYQQTKNFDKLSFLYLAREHREAVEDAKH